MSQGHPSLNSVVLVGTVFEEPAVSTVDRKRVVTVGVATSHEAGDRIHRVVIEDEFLSSAVHGSLVAGTLVHVLGEIDYDDEGALVSVTNRRGSDVQILGAGTVRTESGAAPSPPPRPAAVQPRPQASPVAQAERTSTQETPAARPDPGGTPPAAAPPRPTVPGAAVRMPPRVGGLAGIRPTAEGASQEPPDDASGEDGTTAPPSATGTSGTTAPTPAARVAMPPRLPPTVPRPASVAPAQPRPTMPSGATRPLPVGRAGNGGERRPLAPAADDDEIPF